MFFPILEMENSFSYNLIAYNQTISFYCNMEWKRQYTGYV